MREESSRWEQINPSAFAHEKAGLRELASYLPDTDPYHVWANVEFVGTDGTINEIDALVLTPSGLYVLELKHWQGDLGGDGTQWVRRVPGGRLVPEDNPYILANRKAKRLAGLIKYYARLQGKEALCPFVGAAVFLHATNFRSTLDAVGRQHVYGPHDNDAGLAGIKEFLLEQPTTPHRLIDTARGRQIVELVRGAKIRPSVADRKIGQLILHPRPFAEGIGWQDFLAGHALNQDLERRVRIYLTSRAPIEDVPVVKRAADREFRLLAGIHHPGIAHPVDLVEHALGTAVVFDHIKGSLRLDQWLTQRAKKLTLAQKLGLVQDLAEILDYAHSRRLSHRALHPRAVFVTHPERARSPLSVTDWQTAGRLAGSTQVTRLSASTDGAGLEMFFDDEIRRYQAPESITHARVPGVQLDVFGLGAIAYRVFTGSPPAETSDALVAAVRDRGLNLAAVVDGMPNSLVTLVYGATHGDPTKRLSTVAEFRKGLDAVWEELTAPEAEPVTDPLEARKGDVLDGGLKVVRRLGSGATATALLVTRGDGDETHEYVLKVARDEQHSERLVAEAATLAKLKHAQIASLVEPPRNVGGRTALLLESAGPRTLAEDLQHGRLALDFLERYGRDLLDVVTYLDGQGIWHRDLKPANLAARPRNRDRELHLCAFDFSLASIAADQLTAGTPPYLDPFLGPPRRNRYDAAAERFAAAVTLFEMATGTVPRWGDHANPATITDEVTLDPSAFDQDYADQLIEFFRRALARDARARFDTVEEMSEAWRAIFRDGPTATTSTLAATAVETMLTLDTPLGSTDLTPRARSALERLGAHTVGDLVGYEPSKLTRAQGVPDATRKEILALARSLRPLFATTTERVDKSDDAEVAHGVDAVCATLVPTGTARERTTMSILLGRQAMADGKYLRWPAQTEAARGTGQTQPQISTWLRKWAKAWVENNALTQVRHEMVALLDTRGRLMSSVELGEALLAARGSAVGENARLPQAIGLVRAAVEAELSRGGDARVAIRRFRASDLVLVGREPDDPTSETTAADLLEYAVSLGQRAVVIAAADPLLTRQRAIQDLRTIPVPDGLDRLGDQRLLQIAAEASNGAVAVSAQGVLYPVGMPAVRALRLAASALAGQRIGVDAMAARVRARFPRAAALPPRPELDGLIADCGLRLSWDSTAQMYAPPTWQTSASPTRVGSSVAPLTATADIDRLDAKLAATIAGRGFLALLASPRNLAGARRALLARHRLVEVDITAVMLDRLRAQGLPWEEIVAADNGNPADADFRGLVDLVRHHVLPSIVAALAHDDPILITEAAPLARYGQLGLLRELADPTRARPAARLLLLPARRPEPAMLDDVQLPLTSPSTQSLWLPDAWVTTPVEGNTRS